MHRAGKKMHWSSSSGRTLLLLAELALSFAVAANSFCLHMKFKVFIPTHWSILRLHVHVLRSIKSI
jgi:hypothetical protein